MLRKMHVKIVALVLLISVCTCFMAISKNAIAADDQYKDLIGEWSGVWSGGSFINRSAIVIHEIIAEEAKARITFSVDRLDMSHEEYEVVADFISVPVPTIKFKTNEKDFTCVYRKRAKKLDVSYEGSALGMNMSTSLVMEKRLQLYSNIEELLARNPLPEGKKSQAIKISENDNATIYLIRSREGAGLEPHFHASHDEMLYVIKGTGQLLVDGKWVDLKPGSIHFNPIGKVHANKQVGLEPLVAVSVFSPGMRDPDRHFIQK